MDADRLALSPEDAEELLAFCLLVFRERGEQLRRQWKAEATVMSPAGDIAGSAPATMGDDEQQQS